MKDVAINFKEKLQTVNVTPGKNTCEYIIVHHTGTGKNTTKGNLNGLLGIRKEKNPRSAHFLISENGDTYKLASPDQITRHAGISKWGKKTGMNNYSIGIEVIGPLPGFTFEQKVAVKSLIRHLMFVYKVPPQNVLRHKDISAPRKVDIDDSFWNEKYKSWTDYQNSLPNN